MAEHGTGETPDQRTAATLEHQAHHDGHPQKAVKVTESKLAKHRDLIIVSLSLLSVIIGYMSWKGHSAGKKAAASTDAAATDTGISPDDLSGIAYTSGTGSAGTGFVAGAGGSSGDPLAGLQGYFSNLSDELSQINANTSGGALNAKPSGFSLADGLRYVRNAADGAIYQVEEDGTFYHLTPQQYAALGHPAYTGYGTAPVKPKPKAGVPAPRPKPKPIPVKPKPIIKPKPRKK